MNDVIKARDSVDTQMTLHMQADNRWRCTRCCDVTGSRLLLTVCLISVGVISCVIVYVILSVAWSASANGIHQSQSSNTDDSQPYTNSSVAYTQPVIEKKQILLPCHLAKTKSSAAACVPPTFRTLQKEPMALALGTNMTSPYIYLTVSANTLIIAGDDVTLHCDAATSQPYLSTQEIYSLQTSGFLETSWHRVNDSGGTPVVLQENQNLPSTLTLSKVTTDDSGTYKCITRFPNANIVGMAEITLQVMPFLSCDGVLCLNSGSCMVHDTGAACQCVAGWQGAVCQQDLNECLLNPCIKAVCNNTQGSFLCSCLPGYMLSSSTSTVCIKSSAVGAGSVWSVTSKVLVISVVLTRLFHLVLYLII